MDSKTFAYYRLTDYYQNHRRYVKSRDDVQLLAATKEQLANPASDCSPYDTNGSAPIGLFFSRISKIKYKLSTLWRHCQLTVQRYVLHVRL